MKSKYILGLWLLLITGAIVGRIFLSGASAWEVTEQEEKIVIDDHHANDDPKNPVADDHHANDSTDKVLVVIPKTISQDELSEKTYVWTIYSPYFGQVYPLRDGIIKDLRVDVGDAVSKWDVLGTLSQQTFVPELADMQAWRQSDVTAARGEVYAAQLEQKQAKNAKQAYVNSLWTQLDTSGIRDLLDQQVIAQANKSLLTLRELENKLLQLDQEALLLEQWIEVEKQGNTNEMLAIENELLALEGQIETSILYAYKQLVSVFYQWSYEPEYNLLPSYFGAKKSTITHDFRRQFSSVYLNISKIHELSTTQITQLARDTSNLVDLWIDVLNNSVPGWDYSTVQLIKDQQILVEAKVNDEAGLLKVLTDIQLKEASLINQQNLIEQWWKSLEIQKAWLVLQKEQLQLEIDRLRQESVTETLEQYSDVQEKKRELTLQEWEYLQTLQSYDMDIVKAEGEVAITNARLKATQQALWILQQGWFNNNIIAPFDGTITKRFLTIGNTVSADSPIFDLVDSSKGNEKFVRFEVPEHEFDNVKQDQTIKFIRVQDPVRHYQATITRIANAVDQQTKGILVEAELDKEYEKVLLWWTVVVMFEQNEQVSLIPLTAVFEADDSELYIWKVIDGTLIKQTVKTGKSIGDQIYVTEWVNPTDTIVADATSVEGKETGDSISVVQWFQANESDQWLDALGDGHDHAH